MGETAAEGEASGVTTSTVKQLSLDEVNLPGPSVGDPIEYAPYWWRGGGVPPAFLWKPAVVISKESQQWPQPRPGEWDRTIERVYLEIEWQDCGRARRSGRFVDHEGYVWRYPGSSAVSPNPY